MRHLGSTILILMSLTACQTGTTHDGQPAPASGGAGPVYASNEIDQPPEDADCLEPNPIAASGQRVVTLTFVLGVDGRPESGSITPHRQGNRRYLEAAKRRLLSCRWDPAMLNGESVRMRMVWLARFVIVP